MQHTDIPPTPPPFFDRTGVWNDFLHQHVRVKKNTFLNVFTIFYFYFLAWFVFLSFFSDVMSKFTDRWWFGMGVYGCLQCLLPFSLFKPQSKCLRRLRLIIELRQKSRLGPQTSVASGGHRCHAVVVTIVVICGFFFFVLSQIKSNWRTLSTIRCKSSILNLW